MSDQQGTPYQQPASAANEWTKLVFVFNQLLRGKATAMLVEVLACSNSGGIAPVGTVDVKPLVAQVNGQGTSPEPHGPIYGLPYNRVQGGAMAVIIDPVPGDIGLAVFCSRDSTGAFAAKGPASPASDDVMGFNSGMYFGGFLNAAPTSYVAYVPGQGIQIVDPQAITLQAPSVTVQATNVTVNATTKAQVTSPDIELTGNTTVTGSLTVTGAAALQGGVTVSGGSGTNTVTGTLAATVDVTAAGKSLHNHVHAGQGSLVAGATPVTGNTAAPT